MVQLFKYHKSNSILFFIISGLGVAPLKPLTCAHPVKPGLHLCLLRKLLNKLMNNECHAQPYEVLVQL